MANLNCKYLGLNLKNPLIIGSCGLTNNIEKMKELEAQGAGAIVLKSIFEEQITNEVMQAGQEVAFDVSYRDAFDYIKGYTEMASYQKYTDLIRQAKAALQIPVIASINCTSSGDWTAYAKRIEDAGADALELNLFFLPSDFEKTGIQYEETYFKIVEKVRSTVSIPIAIKISHYFSGLANTLQRMSRMNINGMVLFNRFYSPDIDIETMTTKGAPIFEESDNFYDSLRWIALLDKHVSCDLCATSGIADGKDMIKQLLVGAEAVQVVSAVYNKGVSHIATMLKDSNDWMDRHQFATIDQVVGKMSFKEVAHSEAFLRVQFMKHFAGITE